MQRVAEPLRGVFPIAPTPFTETGELDLEGQRRVLDCMIGGLRATKTVMQAGGVIRSDAVRHPLEPLHPATRAELLELAAQVSPLALRWGK